MNSNNRRFQSQTSNIPSSRRIIKNAPLSESILLELKEAFQLFDPNHTQTISYHQLKIIMRAVGFQVKKSEVVQLARQYDIEETGRINFDDYTEIMKKKYQERDPIEEILKAFKLFDSEGRGKIGLHELKKVAKQLGETLKQEQLAAMIDQFDRDGDGCINQEEFLAIIRPSTF